MKDSKIEWCDHTANLWWGCVGVHRGCDNCYAERIAGLAGVRWGHNTQRLEQPKVWHRLIDFNKIAQKERKVQKVFVGSMMDIFEKPMSVVGHDGILREYKTDYLRDILFEEFIPQNKGIMFLLLTKRPGLINRSIPASWLDSPPDNVMFGASVVDEASAYQVATAFEVVNGRKFLSVEPQLEALDFSIGGPFGNFIKSVDWVIQGGESGPKRRPFDLAWADKMREACREAGVPYFFKQIDKVTPVPDSMMVREFPAMHNPDWNDLGLVEKVKKFIYRIA